MGLPSEDSALATIDAKSPPVATYAADVLIVDDEQAVRDSLTKTLRREGYKTYACADFDSAIQTLNQQMFPVSIVDINLPGTNGIALLSYIHGLQTNIQVIIITGDPTVATAREAIRLGAYDYISKPFRRSELLTVVGRALARYRVYREKQRLEKENLLYQQALEQLVEQRTGQLRESEEKYRVLFHRAIDAIFLLDVPMGTIRDLNLAALKLIGSPTENVTGKPFKRYIASQLDEVFQDIADGTKNEWHWDNLQLQQDNGEKCRVQLSIGAIDLQFQKILQVICRDITDKLALEEHHRQMEIELLSEKSLASIGLLASGIAHNINTPLMGIYGLSQLLKMRYPDQLEVDDVLAQAERINQIVRNLMWKSRQEQDKSAQELNISQLLREELKFLESDLDYKHNIVKNFSLSNDLPLIQGVYSDFSQSLMNIVRNALDAMWNQPSRNLRISTASRGEDIIVEIEDTGCGIAPDRLDAIFTPFFTTKPIMGEQAENEPTGTGLGLSIARRLLEPYGVRFEIDSTVGKGTKFILSIPTHRPDVPLKVESSE